MALVSIPELYFGAETTSPFNTSPSSAITIGQRHIFCLVPIKTGNVDKIYIRTASIVGAVTLSVRIESVVGNTATTPYGWRPTGNLIHANATTTISPSGSNNLQVFNFANSFPVNVNQPIAIVMQLTGGTNWRINFTPIMPYGSNTYSGKTMWLIWNGTAYSEYSDTLQAALGYTDGTCPYSYATNLGYVTQNDLTIQGVRGIRLAMPFNCKAVGIWCFQPTFTTTAGATQQVKLLDDSSSPTGTPLRSSRVYANGEGRSAGSGSFCFYYFTDGEIQLNAGVWYKYLLDTNLVGGTITSIFNNTSIPNSFKENFGRGPNIEFVQASGSSWTIDATKMMHIGPIISAIDDGSGGLRLPMAMNGGYSA